jgi:hypothetical protein
MTPYYIRQRERNFIAEGNACCGDGISLAQMDGPHWARAACERSGPFEAHVLAITSLNI